MYGLLGKKLGHSFSKKIHEKMTNMEYNLIETDDLNQIFSQNIYKGLNVTIPYKTKVIPYLDELSTIAKETNAVNTIIFKSGKKIGYNTDYYGLEKALSYHNISVASRRVLIMGNGSTSRTIKLYCEKNLAQNIVVLARNPEENEYHFNDVDNFKNYEIIFNATPVGMFPHVNDELIFSLDLFDNLISVVDVVYNPLRSNLLIEAESLGIKAVNGLFMLISQAVKSIELFHNIHITDPEIIELYKSIKLEMLNLVFIGMPMSGKSYFAKLCSKIYHKDVIDIDQEIEDVEDNIISNIFKSKGEKYFRSLEYEQTLKFSKDNNKAISCGGGVVLNEKNINNLKHNGVIIYIYVPLEFLKKCNPKGRPLLKDKKNLEKLFFERYHLYKQSADIILKKRSYDETPILRDLEVKINEYISS